MEGLFLEFYGSLLRCFDTVYRRPKTVSIKTPLINGYLMFKQLDNVGFFYCSEQQ